MSKRVFVLLILCAVWGYTGWCNYHYELGHFTAEFPDQNHVSIARQSTVFGPVGYLLDLADDPRIWLDKPYTCQQRWDEFRKSAETLSKDYFVHYGGNYGCKVEELR